MDVWMDIMDEYNGWTYTLCHMDILYYTRVYYIILSYTIHTYIHTYINTYIHRYIYTYIHTFVRNYIGMLWGVGNFRFP